MEAATAFPSRQSASFHESDMSVSRESNRMLTATATYMLSEDGRKASLLAGGDGRALQEHTIQVPATRLHLVHVDTDGTARLKLRPRYQLNDAGAVTRTDEPPTYDAPPDLDELFREAARNHELGSAFLAARRASRTQHRDTERERRARIAQAFLSDPTQRAMAHPSPTETHCYLLTTHGRELFESRSHEVPARLVPAEAFRRFMTDLRERRARNRPTRAAQMKQHEEKMRFAADWIAAHGTLEQQARQTAGLLSLPDAIALMTDQAFAAVEDRPRYSPLRAAQLQTHLRQCSKYADVVLADGDVRISTGDATSATAAQWALLNTFKQALPSAAVVLRQHAVAWKRRTDAPVLTSVGVLVTCDFGPFVLRREYAAP
jgi:hypothetical protein